MLETFTPTVCGSRRRQRAAVVLFTVSAVLAAALFGAALGFVGAAVGAREAVLAAGALALVAAAREAGLVRLPLPQARRQVPERWRFELPLPFWASGYGAGLGVGVFTFQPVSTFWVACAGALALARPLPAALCFSVYGAGRAASVLWARARVRDAGEAVERLTGRRRGLLRANAVALAACAALLFLAPAAGAKPTWVGRGFDPTTSYGVVGYARGDGSVVLEKTGRGQLVFEDARSPSLDGRFLAYADDSGIRVVNWRTGRQVRRVRGAVSAPALDWPRIAFVRELPRSRALVVRNLLNDRWRVISNRRKTVRYGRPSNRGGWIAWSATGRRLSVVNVYRVRTGRWHTVARTRIAFLSNASVNAYRVLWVVERSGAAELRLGWTRRWGARTLGSLQGRTSSWWTTTLGSGVAYATRWWLPTRAAAVYRYRL
jgi:hypothetical protein